LGPYNDSFVKTEVEVGESKIDAIRETVNEMKHYGVHVCNFNWKDLSCDYLNSKTCLGCNWELVNWRFSSSCSVWY